MPDFQLMHGDCLELMKQLPDASVDMILCDLPYGTTQNKWDSVWHLLPEPLRTKQTMTGARHGLTPLHLLFL